MKIIEKIILYLSFLAVMYFGIFNSHFPLILFVAYLVFGVLIFKLSLLPLIGNIKNIPDLKNTIFFTDYNPLRLLLFTIVLCQGFLGLKIVTGSRDLIVSFSILNIIISVMLELILLLSLLDKTDTRYGFTNMQKDEKAFKKYWRIKRSRDWKFWLCIIIVIFGVTKFTVNRYKIYNSEYGRKMNRIREAMGIPVIDNELKPAGIPINKFDGIRWRNDTHPTVANKLIHNSKTVDAVRRGRCPSVHIRS